MQVLFCYISFIVSFNEKVIQININLGRARGVDKGFGHAHSAPHLKLLSTLMDITHRKTDESLVAEHFNSETHTESDMAVMAIDIVRSRDACPQKIQKSRWIRTLGTSSPLGM